MSAFKQDARATSPILFPRKFYLVQMWMLRRTYGNKAPAAVLDSRRDEHLNDWYSGPATA
jgi:hypothetical protein